MLVEELQTQLASSPAIQAQLGTTTTRSNGGNGIYPTQAPDQCSTPYIVTEQVGGGSIQTSFQGTGSLQEERWRFSCYGSSYKEAKRVCKVVTSFLLSLNGLIGPTAELHGSWQEMEIDSSEPLARGTIYSSSVDFRFIYLDLDSL